MRTSLRPGIREERHGPLFRSVDKHRHVTRKPMTRIDAFRMINRRAAAAALPFSTSCHTFRATGITASDEGYLENGGTIEKVQQIAANEFPPPDEALRPDE